MSSSRRDFLKQLSTATALGALYQFPGRELWALTPGDLVPEPDEALLRRLALMAVDAARGAGASFADVRVTGMRRFRWMGIFDRSRQQRPSMDIPSLAFTTGYGVRAIVDGAWGFAGGTVLTPEAVTGAAGRAVSRARANRPRRARRLELAPVAASRDAVWAPSIKQDPFEVPVGEQADVGLAGLVAAESVRGVIYGNFGAGWTQKVNVFASSEGSLIVQRLTEGGGSGYITGKSQDHHEAEGARTEALKGGWYGYEAVGQIDVVAEMRKAAERAVANSKPPGPTQVPTEVGRYDLVLSGWAVQQVMQTTLAPALNLERALGYLANTEGTSFAAPPLEILGRYQVGSPLLNLHADRTRPHALGSVGYDDEGVAADEWQLIKDGVIVDYLTSRQTAAEIAPAYRARGDAVESRGCMVGSGERRPEIDLPNLTVLPNQEDVSFDDLIADTKRGICITGGTGFGTSDQQLLSGQFGGGGVYEIKNGKLGRPLRDFAFQMLTPQFWKSVDALGGSSTVREGGRNYYPGLIQQHKYSYSASAPAARVRQVNVLNMGITL